MAPAKYKFREGEKVLCHYGALIHEAQCLEIIKEKRIKYRIHYIGWNNKWDEWVPENRILKYNKTNVQKQREVQRAHLNQQSQKNKKRNTTTRTQRRRSERGKEKDADSKSSTPVADKSMSRFSKSTSSTVMPLSSHEFVSEPPRKKRSHSPFGELLTEE